VRKELAEGLTYEKTYTFYPERFDVRTVVNKQYGIPSRAYYEASGTFEDDKGNRVTVDGRGDNEGVRNAKPKWYVVYADDWAHSCVALTEMGGLTYWDSDFWGGIGFGTSKLDSAVSYVIHAGAKSGDFGRVDYERLKNPPQVRLVQ